MLSRRHFLRFFAGLGAAGVSTVAYNCDVVVSGGLGCSIMPFRLGVPPEIVLVTLGGNAGV